MLLSVDRPAVVRVWAVRTTADGLARFRRLVKLWPCVIAAQQANIVRDAEASQYHDGDQYGYSSHAVSVTRPMAPTDADRLRQMCQMWPNLDRRKQAELVAYAEMVS